MSDNTMTQDFSKVKMDLTVSGSALINALLPHIISSLQSNASFRQSLVNAILPTVRQVAASTAKATAGGKK
jgi:hypothetical protein